MIGEVILGHSQLGRNLCRWIDDREIVDHRGHLLPAVLIRKALGTVVLALKKHLAGKSRRVLDVGARSAPACNKAFFGNLFNRSFDGDFGNAIELTELNDGGQLIARFKCAVLDASTDICSYRLVFGNHAILPSYLRRYLESIPT